MAGQHRGEGLADPDRSVIVGVEDLAAKVHHRRVQHAAVQAGDAGVVHQYVDALEVILGHAKQMLDVFLTVDIGCRGNRLPACAQDFLHHFCAAPLGVFIGPVVHHHPRARRRQFQGNTAPDSGIGAGDDRHAPRQIHCMPHAALLAASGSGVADGRIHEHRFR
ncbi:hypothetical protein G6F68_015152 [Rhizopus microsporus]|nr:hypothetical protein G6F68_015152 [Rhizopus microsporus]